MQQSWQEVGLLWDAGATGGILAYYAIILAPLVTIIQKSIVFWRNWIRTSEHHFECQDHSTSFSKKIEVVNLSIDFKVHVSNILK